MRSFRASSVPLLVAGLSLMMACSKRDAVPSKGPAGAATSASTSLGAGTAKEIAAGAEHTCARLGSGAIACWGSNKSGQLGAIAKDTCTLQDLLGGGGESTSPCSPKPLLVPAIEGATRVVAGGDTTCARTTAGAIFCWGRNDGGLVGDGTTTPRRAPARVSLPAAADDVSMSDTHACARLVDGTVACWGIAFDGQLGFAVRPTADVATHGELSTIGAPARVTGLSGATRVTVGSRVTCATLATGAVECWGKAALGDKGTSLRIPRTAIPELTGAKEIFLGQGTHCATFATPAGTSCWGASSEGPLAKGTDQGLSWSKLVPSRAVSLPRALVIAYGRACVIDSKGDVTCWGYDGKGTSAPTKIEGLAHATHLAVGASHVCTLDEGGHVACWGGTASGQVGRIEGPRVSPLFGPTHMITLP